MESSSRYEIINTIAKGEFAVVYRARDRQLGREVAIKQIHEQYRADPRQLERYWGEAQLLASLQHGNIVTVYDVDRKRGWLILELMRGSLKRSEQSKPLDLDLLRMVLIGSLNALQFLHGNGVVHGDIKPSNLMIDMQNRVKLGDFGLARRASTEGGSLLKGTTKYMAPELISNDFGPVGPASDLYSLGFTAYELLCGAQFDDLFPGLRSYGANMQIAWMMWHGAADRKLPEIGRVLEGVPNDLAKVINRLVAKDQSVRYKSATEALGDLHASAAEIEPPVEQVDPEEEAARIAEAKKKRLRRIGAVAAMVCSLLMCVAILLPKPAPPPPKKPAPPEGVLRQVFPREHLITLQLDDGTPKDVPLKGELEVEINGQAELIRDLREGDYVVVKTYRKPSGQLVTQLHATRPELSEGRILAVNPRDAQFDLTIDGKKPRQLTVNVPEELEITFNGEKTFEGRPVKLSDLKAEDRVIVHHLADEGDARRATELEVLRVVTTEGVVRNLDKAKETLTVAVGDEDNPTMVTLPFVPDCEVTLNDRRVLDERQLKPRDLRPGDQVKLAHDDHIKRIDAYRVLGQKGKITRIRPGADRFEARMDGGTDRVRFSVGKKTVISLGGETVTLDDLRAGDEIEVTHDAPDASVPELLTLAATRPSDPDRWAAVVSVQDCEDSSVAPLPYAASDAALLRDKLVDRFRVPEDQVYSLDDPNRVQIKQGLKRFLNGVPSDGKLVVYFVGHAFMGDDGKVYLAAKNFRRKRTADSGLALQWLVDRMEECEAKEKLLLLDCSHEGKADQVAKQPSVDEMIDTLDALPGRVPFRTVTVLASCSKGQRGHGSEKDKHGLFALALADGFSGKADKNRDDRLEWPELETYVRGKVAAGASELGQAQSPRLILPDNRPPRLSEDAKKAIRRLAALVGQHRVPEEEMDRAFGEANALAAGQPEPRWLKGLLLMQRREWPEALELWQSMKMERPDDLIALQGLAWHHFMKPRGTYGGGIEALTEMVDRIPTPEKPSEWSQYDLARFDWAGQLRDFTVLAATEEQHPRADRLEALDKAVARHGELAIKRYDEGRRKARVVRERFTRQLQEASGEPQRARIIFESRRLLQYVAFPNGDVVQQILEGLDW